MIFGHRIPATLFSPSVEHFQQRTGIEALPLAAPEHASMQNKISKIAGNALSSFFRAGMARGALPTDIGRARQGRGRSGISAPVVILIAVSGLALAGCDADIRADAGLGIEEGQRLTAAQRDRLRKQLDGEVIRESRPFYGSAVEVNRGKQSGEPLPKKVEGARGVGLRITGQADVRQIASAITEASGIPVNIRTRYIVDDGDVIEVPIGTRMRVNYEGALSAFLDQLAARMDVAWDYDGIVITVDRMPRRTWRIALPLGTTEITDSAETQRGPSISTTRTLDPWASLQQRLAPLAPAPARITLAPEEGRVEVFGPPSVQKAVGQVLEDVAATANTRIGLDVAVYFVDADKSDEFGIGVNVDGNFRSAGGERVRIGLDAPVDLLGGGGVIGIIRDNDAIAFQSLAKNRAVVDYRLASSIAQSGVITPISITNEENYVRSKTVERDGANTGDTGGTPSPGGNTADPGRVTYEIETLERGLSLTALPRLIDTGRIHLALTVSQRQGDIKPLVDGIQTPDIENREIRNQTVLAPGETLILSGYEQDVSIRGDSGLGLFRKVGLGGKTEASRRKVRMILMVRPTLIPQGRGRT